MRIGVISTVGGYSWAGTEEVWKQMGLRALADGHSLVVSATPEICASTELAELRSRGLRIHPREQLNGLTRRFAIRGLLNRYASFWRERPDIVCLSMGSPTDYVWLPDLQRSLQRTRIPVIPFIHGNADGFIADEAQRIILRKLYGESPILIMLSRDNQAMLERQLAIRLPNVVLLSNPVRNTLQDPLPWPRSDDAVRFANVARFEVIHKCQDHLLEAFAQPLWKNRNWSLTLFGSGPDETHIKALREMYGLHDRVTLGGYVRDFRQIWKNNHIHVLPSRAEGQSLALLESTLCGRPAIVTPAGGHADYILDGQHGFVSPSSRSEFLSATLDRAWEARREWANMGLAAHNRAKEHIAGDPSQSFLSVLLAHA